MPQRCRSILPTGAHGGYFGLTEKYARREEESRRPKAVPTPAGDANPFIDPDGYKKFVAEKEQEFRTELVKQTSAANSAETGCNYCRVKVPVPKSPAQAIAEEPT